MRANRLLLACVFASSWISMAMAAQFTDTKTILLQAIDAPDGRAQGEIVGPIADKFRETTKSSAPAKLDIGLDALKRP